MGDEAASMGPVPSIRWIMGRVGLVGGVVRILERLLGGIVGGRELRMVRETLNRPGVHLVRMMAPSHPLNRVKIRADPQKSVIYAVKPLIHIHVHVIHPLVKTVEPLVDEGESLVHISPHATQLIHQRLHAKSRMVSSNAVARRLWWWW